MSISNAIIDLLGEFLRVVNELHPHFELKLNLRFLYVSTRRESLVNLFVAITQIHCSINTFTPFKSLNIYWFQNKCFIPAWFQEML